ncbi:RHS repeat-associated core domain-containing protein [Pseudomonas sp. SWRI99]|uniref:RHS repeat-associated core domain-containing protein n=1 Tax=Pseudomonas sp. SWRI99 TaxID=2745506 RepID=UPI0016449010|nr:RHS repeat-associated core domain-containing protein [Pseudomonas sp. SWRI99]MBC3779724.1 toxin [Pseudomonas sp. SWRI99]
MNTREHWHTPTLSVSDGRGLPVRQIGYLRTASEIESRVNRQQHDLAGRLVSQWDPRLPEPCLTTVYGLDGAVLKSTSVDAGWRLNLPGLAGEPLRRWDARGNQWRTTFDEQLRVVAVEENGEAGVEVFAYADAQADAGHNLRGQLLEQQDRSGTLRTDSFALTGQPLRETRTFGDGEAFTSRRVFSPLGAVLEQTDAGQHRQQSRYGLAGQLRQVQLLINGESDRQSVLLDAHYNAADQIIEQQAGNGVLSHWTYDPADGRLHTQYSRKEAGAVLQNLEYFYDRVGNITRIEDHAFQPSWFANQRVDGHRNFVYDSLYRLIHASGYDDGPLSDIPGLPLPTDPNNRLNYTQTYAYDAGGNLEKLVHVRDGASHTVQMCIDAYSNRAVRCKPDDPPPDFASLFDRHGNQLALQPGHPIQWNVRDEVQVITLVDRGGRDDAEHYGYSQGVRVFKRHETFTASTEHFHQVRYLPGLEIRSKDNGEELHVISVGSARCLHWAKNPPREIANDQLRFSLEDHLGSCAMELDQNARIISHEGYYPFGATAWLTAESAIEVSYRFVRYSGKETDVSGLIHYGARYYAPWLQRWISPDSAGDVDGLNLYGFVGNNPMRFTDPDGNSRAEFVIMLYSQFASAVHDNSELLLGQLHDIIHQKNIAANLALNLLGETLSGIAAYEGGGLGTSQLNDIVRLRPEVQAFVSPGGLIGGNIGGDLAGAMADPVVKNIGPRFGPLIPQTSQMSVSAIDKSLGVEDPVKEITSWRDFKDEVMHPALNAVLNPVFLMNRVVASVIGIIPGALNMGARVQEAEDIKNRLDPAKIQKIEKMLDDWKAAVEQRSTWAENAFDALGNDVVAPASVLPNVNGTTSSETLAPVSRSALRQKSQAILANIARAQAGLGAYKEMGTTDNQFLLKQRHAAARKKAA